MPFAMRDGVRLYWRLDGSAKLPPLVLLNSIGTDLSLWDACVPHLLPAFQTLRIDTRGHGASDAPDGDYSLAMLAADVAAVMDAAGIASAPVAGVSLGGMTAMALALDHPVRVEALVLICTSAAMDRASWADRISTVRTHGLSAIADAAMGRFLSSRFRAGHTAVEDGIRRGLGTMSANGYAGAGAAIRDMDLLNRLPQLSVPTLVVAGTSDSSTPLHPHGAAIAAAIPGAGVLELGCGHLAPVEAPAPLAAMLRQFLRADKALANAEAALFEAGIANRRRVLGDAWVDQAIMSQTPFSADFQAMITRTAWHEIWGRPGLDDRTRRLLVLAITASLGRWEEFRLHTRAGLADGSFTQEELKEVLMQTAIYAGLPVGNTAFKEAATIIETL